MVGLLLLMTLILMGCDSAPRREVQDLQYQLGLLEARLDTLQSQITQASLAQPSPPVDSQRVVVVETLRTVTSDTVVVRREVTVYDTVRTVIATAVVHSPPEAGAETDSVSREELSQIATELRAGAATAAAFQLLTADTPGFSTTSCTELDSVQVQLVAAAFRVPPDRIQRYRWGAYVAPRDHPKAHCHFLTIWYEEGGALMEAVAVVTPTGELTIDRRRPVKSIASRSQR